MEEEVAPKGAIPAVVGSVSTEVSDSVNTRRVVENSFSWSSEIIGMDNKKLTRFKEAVEKCKHNPTRDTSIRTYTAMTEPMEKLEVFLSTYCFWSFGGVSFWSSLIFN